MSEDRWIVIPNWARFQHYGDRSPLWIKVYLELNDRDDWRRLSLAQRGLMVSLWCEYGAANGILRTSDVPGRIAQKVLKSTWESLQGAGWVELSASRPDPLRASTTRGRAPARVETDLEKEDPNPPDGGNGNLQCRKCGGPIRPRQVCPHCGANPRVAGTNPRELAKKSTALHRAEAFTRNAGGLYERLDFEEEIAKYGLDLEESQTVFSIWDEIRASVNGAEEVPWEGEEPPVVDG